MTSYKEIVTKAVVGKCKKTTNASFDVECSQKPDTVLGCWVINHTFNGVNKGGEVSINGSYDVNVWYSYDNDTKTAVSTQTHNYLDSLSMNLKNDVRIDNKNEIIVESLRQPTVSDVKINGSSVSVKVDKEMGVEIIGNTTVKVAVEDDFDEYEEIFDTIDEAELDINVDELNDDFIKEDVNK